MQLAFANPFMSEQVKPPNPLSGREGEGKSDSLFIDCAGILPEAPSGLPGTA